MFIVVKGIGQREFSSRWRVHRRTVSLYAPIVYGIRSRFPTQDIGQVAAKKQRRCAFFQSPSRSVYSGLALAAWGAEGRIFMQRLDLGR